jgi:hypothetical protein
MIILKYYTIFFKKNLASLKSGQDTSKIKLSNNPFIFEIGLWMVGEPTR